MAIDDWGAFFVLHAAPRAMMPRYLTAPRPATSRRFPGSV